MTAYLTRFAYLLAVLAVLATACSAPRNPLGPSDGADPETATVVVEDAS